MCNFKKDCPVCGLPFKLYVWRNVLQDWTPGLAVAYAQTVEAARGLLLHEMSKDEFGNVEAFRKELEAEPEIYSGQHAVYVHGGA